MTPTEAVTTVRYQVAESSANFWSDAEIRVYLTQGERELASLLECNNRVTAFTTTTGTYSYSTAGSDFNTIKHMTYNDGSTAEKLKGVDFRTLQMLDDGAMTTSAQSGDSTHYWRNGNDLILWPTPDASHTVTIYGTKPTTAVASGATAFEVPVQFTEYLPDFALYRMYLKDQDDGKAQMHFKLWMDHKSEAQRLWMRMRFADQFPVVKTDDYPSTVMGII